MRARLRSFPLSRVAEMSVAVQTQDFDVGLEVRAIANAVAEIGAIVTFTGVVRGTAHGQKLEAMTLEHYPGMTEAELERIEGQACERWPLQATRIVHRVGRLRPGDNIVLVVTASAHRHAAFEAAEFLMDYLKTRAPFWKKEALADGPAVWVDARETDTSAADRWETPVPRDDVQD